MSCFVIIVTDRAPLYQDVVSWCRDNNANVPVPRVHPKDKENDKIVYTFLNEEDAVAFRLRFG